MLIDPEKYNLEYLDHLQDDMLAIFLIATQGEGEPTDNFADFYESLIENIETFKFSKGKGIYDKDALPLKNLRYVVFGLGNSTYEYFNKTAIDLDKALKLLGAMSALEIVLGDDDKGLEDYFEKWKHDVYTTLKKKYNLKQVKNQSNNINTEYIIHEITQEDSINDKFEKEYLIHSEYDSILRNDPNKLDILGKSKNAPYFAKINKCYNLCKIGEYRVCLHMELEINPQMKSIYETGDHATIWPINPKKEVEKILKLYNLDKKANQLIKLKSKTSNSNKSNMTSIYYANRTTYLSLFTYYLDIVKPPTKQFLQQLKAISKLKPIIDYLTELTVDYLLVTNFKTTGDILLDIKYIIQEENSKNNNSKDTVYFPNEYLDLKLENLIDNYKRMIPRYYSISSSNLASPNKIDITAVVLNYESYYNKKKNLKNSNTNSNISNLVYGLCTNYFLAIHNYMNKDKMIKDKTIEYNIEKMKEDFNIDNEFRIPLYVRKSNFKLPKKDRLLCPLIMIGPGTGIAPLRGFIQERLYLKNKNEKIGQVNLYFGCRNEEEHLYKEEIYEMFNKLNQKKNDIDSKKTNNSNGEIIVEEHRYRFGYSRSKSLPKTYVQDLMKKDIKHLNNLICQRNAYVYVCGDGRNMAKEVFETIAEIVMYENDDIKSIEQATSYVKRMKTDTRYLEDVWY